MSAFTRVYHYNITAYVRDHEPNICQICVLKDGKQITSEEWLNKMTAPRVVENKDFRGMQYGYLWWVIRFEKNVYAAIGNSGNVIYVNPEENITAAVSSYFKSAVFDRVNFIEDVLLPCFR